MAPHGNDWQFGDIIRTTQSVAALKQRRQAKQESKLERQRTSRLVAKARQSARDYKIFTCAEFDEGPRSPPPSPCVKQPCEAEPAVLVERDNNQPSKCTDCLQPTNPWEKITATRSAWHHNEEEENNDWELVEEGTLEEDAIMVASPVRRGPIGPLDYMPTPLSEFVVKKAGQKKKNEWELL